MTTVPLRWRKSTRSSGQDTCVELANTLGAVRDSKNPTGPVLVADTARLVVFVRASTAS